MGKVLQIKKQNEFVVDIQNNNETTLKELYHANYPKVELLVLKNNGTKDEAKDLYQEAFLAMWKNVKEYKFEPKNETAIQGYLYQIAKNKWTDYLRSSRYKKTTKFEESKSNIKLSEEDGFNEIQKENELQQLEKGLAKLGDECRRLLQLFYFKKQSLSEIAGSFGIGEPSARNKKYRCIVQLKKLMLDQNHA